MRKHITHLAKSVFLCVVTIKEKHGVEKCRKLKAQKGAWASLPHLLGVGQPTVMNGLPLSVKLNKVPKNVQHVMSWMGGLTQVHSDISNGWKF